MIGKRNVKFDKEVNYIHSTHCTYKILLLKMYSDCLKLCAVRDMFNAAQCNEVNDSLEI